MVSPRLPSANPTPRTALDRFMREKKANNLSENTILWYSRQVGYFVNFLESRNVGRMDAITGDHIADYKLVAADRTRGPASTGRRSMIGSVRAFLLWVAEKEMVSPETARVEMPKVAQKAIPAMSREQLDAMLRVISDESRYPERDEVIVLLLLDSMLRVSELCNLKIDDLRDYSIRITAKGNIERWRPISPRTRRAIERWLAKRQELEDDEGYLFITSAYNPMSRFAALDLVKRFGQRANIQGVRLSPHTLRHTGAFRWIQKGGDALRLQEMLGHTTLEMTRR